MITCTLVLSSVSLFLSKAAVSNKTEIVIDVGTYQAWNVSCSRARHIILVVQYKKKLSQLYFHHKFRGQISLRVLSVAGIQPFGSMIQAFGKYKITVIFDKNEDILGYNFRSRLIIVLFQRKPPPDWIYIVRYFLVLFFWN